MITCDKCGSLDIDKIYMPPINFHETHTPEFLRCSCQTCGYTWAEDPISEKKK